MIAYNLKSLGRHQIQNYLATGIILTHYQTPELGDENASFRYPQQYLATTVFFFNYITYHTKNK